MTSPDIRATVLPWGRHRGIKISKQEADRLGIKVGEVVTFQVLAIREPGN